MVHDSNPAAAEFSESARARYWVFTLNNYTQEEVAHLLSLEGNPNLAFLSFGREVGEQGTPHLQGHLELKQRLRFRQLKSLVGDRVWLAPRRGTFEQAQQYVEKDGNVSSFGERVSVGRGARTDLAALKNALDERMPMRRLSDEFFGEYLRYRRSILAYRALHAVKRNWDTPIVVYWGSTGKGKTRAVYDNATFHQIWEYPGGGWFDTYDEHPIALFDEFTGSEFKISYLLKLLDRYPMQVPVKGGFVNWAPKEIYFTSNLDPMLWYHHAHPEHVEALFRRITNIVHFE